jgi:two-component system chemotaxis sensor kinase CheA
MPKDPYKYFRVEARDLVEGLSQGFLKLERGPVDKGHVGHLLRLAHTLKGAARVVKQPSIAELAHAVEESLAGFRESGGHISKEHVTSLLELLDRIKTKLSELSAPPSEGPKEAAADGLYETVRVDIGDLDLALEGISEAALALSRIRRTGGQEAWSHEIEHAQRELLQAQEHVGRIRLVEAQRIFATLERAARDAAQSLNKNVEFETRGGEIRLEAQVLSALNDVLLHVVRNAVAHGIERETDRIAAGKAAAGRVTVQVERRGNRVAFVCRDDGRGIDVEAIRQVAVRRGLVPASQIESLGLEEAVRLILRGGVTTAGAPTEVSGRGIGLDVVRDTVARLKGDVRIKSEPGRGARIEIIVPLSLSSQSALHVAAGTGIAGIPLDSVEGAIRIRDEELARSQDGISLNYEGAVIPFLFLSQLLETSKGPWKASSTIVVRAQDSRLAVGVDRILGVENVTLRPLPAYLRTETFVGGASIGSDGNPVIYLDPKGLFDASAHLKPPAAPATAPALPLLIIDDSLTTRMLEQSILESAGFEVDVAVSAEEGLKLARKRRYGAFVVDVEMPGMDGFAFVQTTRSDPQLRDVPAILVTSRNALQDRQRGEEAGAKAYIYKGEFDQGHLLQTIRRLLEGA